MKRVQFHVADFSSMCPKTIKSIAFIRGNPYIFRIMTTLLCRHTYHAWVYFGLLPELAMRLQMQKQWRGQVALYHALSQNLYQFVECRRLTQGSTRDQVGQCLSMQTQASKQENKKNNSCQCEHQHMRFFSFENGPEGNFPAFLILGNSQIVSVSVL